jgi:hypothetical protein
MARFNTKAEFLIWLKGEQEQLKKRRAKEHKERWENLPRFTKPQDVPDLPMCDNELYITYYVPKLIKAGAIPKKDLVDGQTYWGQYRNVFYATWDAKAEHFKYTYDGVPTHCNHFEDDNGFALFVPIAIVVAKK